MRKSSKDHPQNQPIDKNQHAQKLQNKQQSSQYLQTQIVKQRQFTIQDVEDEQQDLYQISQAKQSQEGTIHQNQLILEIQANNQNLPQWVQNYEEDQAPQGTKTIDLTEERKPQKKLRKKRQKDNRTLQVQNKDVKYQQRDTQFQDKFKKQDGGDMISLQKKKRQKKQIKSASQFNFQNQLKNQLQNQQGQTSENDHKKKRQKNKLILETQQEFLIVDDDLDENNVLSIHKDQFDWNQVQNENENKTTDLDKSQTSLIQQTRKRRVHPKSQQQQQQKDLYFDQNQQKLQMQQEMSLLDQALQYKKYIAMALVLLIVIGVAVGLIFKYVISSDGPLNTNRIALAVNRPFKANTVYKYDYILNADIQNQSMTSNYTCIFAVETVDQNYISFLSIALKNSQSSSNDTIYYSPSQIYQHILKGIIQNVAPFSLQDSISNSSNFTASFSNSTYEDVNLYHPIFKFVISLNGTLIKLTFPSNMQSSNVNFLTTFIKMFIPNIDLSLYLQNPNNNTRRLLQTDIGNISSLDSYNMSKQNGSTSLQKQFSVQKNTDQQNSIETGTQQSNFDQSNQLQSSQMSSNMQLASKPQQPSNDTIMQSFDFSLYIQQTAEMIINQKYLTQASFIISLQMFLTNFQPLTLNSSQIEEWIRSGNSMNVSRNLQQLPEYQQTDPLILFQYDKSIVQTNVIGYKVKGSAYFQIGISTKQNVFAGISQDSQYNNDDSIRKQSISKNTSQFYVSIGIKLTLGRNIYKYPLFKKAKQIPPLQINFTIQIVNIQLLAALPPFLADLDSLQTAFSTCKYAFQNIAGLVSTDVTNQIAQIILQLKQQMTLVSPNQIIADVVSQNIILHQIMLDQFSTLYQSLGTQQQTLTSLIYIFTNASFDAQLQKFLAAKSQFINIKNKGSAFMIQEYLNFTGIDQGNSTIQIAHIISQASIDYDNKILSKMVPIFVYLDDIYNKTLQFRQELEMIEYNHYVNFINFCHGMIDYYFINQSITLEPYLNYSQYQVDRITQDLTNWTDFATKKVQQIQNASMLLFQQFLAEMRINSSQSTFYTDLNTSVQASINTVLSQASQNSGVNANIQFKSWISGSFGTISFHHYNMKNQVLGQYNDVNTVINYLKPPLISVINALNAFTSQFQNKLTDPGYTVQSTVMWLANFQFDSNLMQDVYFGTQNMTEHTCIIQNLVQKSFQTFIGITRTLSAGLQKRYLIHGDSSHLYNELAQFKNLTNWVSQILDRFLNYQTRLVSFFQKMNIVIYINLKYQIFAIQDYVYMSADVFRNPDLNIIQASNELQTISLTYDAEKIFRNQLQQNISGLIFVFPINKRSFCQSQPIFQNTTLEIQSQLYTRFVNITDYINLNRIIYFLTYDQLVESQTFFQDRSIHFFQVIFQTTTCQQIPPLDIDVSKLFVLRSKLLYLQDLQLQFYRIWNQSSARVKIQEDLTHLFNYTLFELRSKVEFQNFFFDVGLVRYTMKDNVLVISTDMNNYKRYLKNIYNLGSDLASIQQYDAAISRFQISNFTISSSQMYNQSYQLQKLAIQAYQKLNFQIIAAYVTAKKVYRFYTGGLTNISNNLNNFNLSFIQLTDDFLNTNINTTQQGFTALVDNIKSLKLSLTQLIPINFVRDYTVILTPLYNFTQIKYKQFYNRAIAVLNRFKAVVETDNNQTIKQMNIYINDANTLISGLNIGQLNVLKLIAKVAEDTVLNFSSFFHNKTDQILLFQDIIIKDQCKIVTYKNYFNVINDSLNTQFLKAFTNTSVSISNLVGILKLNPQYFNKILAQSFYPKLLKFIKKDFKNYGILARKTSLQVQLILNLINSISPDLFTLFKALNDIIQKLESIGSASQNNINKVRNFYPNIKQNFFIIRNLIFQDLALTQVSHKEDIAKFISFSSSMVNKDLLNISKVKIESLKNQTIQNQVVLGNLRNIAFLVSALQDKYSNLTLLEKSLQVLLYTYVNQVNQFTGRLSSKVLQILLNSRTRLMSQPPDGDTSKRSITLFQQDIIEPIRKQLASLQYTVITQIGPINFKVALTFNFDIYGFIKLLNYRDISIGVTFDASINLYTEVSFGIPHFLVVGVFIQGSIFQVKLTPSIQFDNLLPLSGIKALSQVQKINDANVLSVKLILEIDFLTCTFTIGVFVDHIWFRFKMGTICIFGFCFQFPIGIEFYIVRNSVSYTFPGILLARFEFQIDVFSHQYLT